MFDTQHLAPPRPPFLPDDFATSDLTQRSRPFLRLTPPGTSIALDVMEPQSLIRVVDGCICLHQTLPGGRRQILEVLGPGQIFGGSLCDMGSISAISMTYSHLEPVKGHEVVSEATRTLQSMLSRLLAHATLLGRKTAPEKVATALLDLASRFPRKSNCARNEEVFNLYLTRADLADWLGLTLETVSRCINAFKRERLVAFDQPEIVTLLEREILSDIAAGRS